MKPTLETMIEETEEESCCEYPFGFSDGPNPLDSFLLPDDKPKPFPPPMKRPKVDTDTYTKFELEERKAEMDTYRSGAFGCCMDEVSEYKIGDKWDEVKSDLNLDASFLPAFCAQVRQLNILKQHNTYLGLFNEIMEWIKFHSNRDETVKWGRA